MGKVPKVVSVELYGGPFDGAVKNFEDVTKVLVMPHPVSAFDFSEEKYELHAHPRSKRSVYVHERLPLSAL